MRHRLTFIFLSYFKIENMTAQIWHYSKLNFKLYIDLYVSYKLKLHSWRQERGWWKEIINSSFPCLVRIPSFLCQNSQCTLQKEPPTTQRGPDSPALAPCTPAVANDTAQCHGPAASLWTDSACDTCQLSDCSKSERARRENLTVPSPSSPGE